MAQTAPQAAGTGRTTASPDIDALLSALNAEASTSLPGRPGASTSLPGRPEGSSVRPEQAPAALSLSEGPAVLPDRPAGDPAARRMQALVRAFDVLHKQVASIASQGETISSIADMQARQEQALGELQRTTRHLRAIVIQQLQGTAPKQDTLPPLQVKLVVAHLAESYRQAQHDAGVLAQWAMLFTGVAVGAVLGAAMSALGGLYSMLLILGTAAAVALLVACIFMTLAYQARRRADQARRAMGESTMPHAAIAATEAHSEH